jgi:hypothetical protein
MSKFISMLSLSSCLVLAAFPLLPIPEPPGYCRFNLDSVALARQAKYLDDQFRARRSFVAIQDDILERLVRGELSLSQACDQLFRSAREAYPRGLTFLRKAAGTMPLKQKMASDLVDCFRFDAEDTPSLLKVAARLEQELNSKPFRDWCEQPWVEKPLGTARNQAGPRLLP